jgi:hypothetical protein
VKHNELSGDLVHTVHVPPTAAGTAIEVPIARVPDNTKYKIVGAYWVPGAAITANGSNYFTLTVRNRGSVDGTGTVVAATRAYSATNGVAAKTETLTLDSDEAKLLAEPGDVLTAAFAHTGSGLAIPAGLLQLVYRYR